MSTDSKPPVKAVRIAVKLVGLCLAVGAVALAVSVIQAARHAAHRNQCSCHHKQIALAIHNYHDVWKCLPPAYIADENGRPMHSWRVLILPWIEQQELYDQYRFDEPWDGPHNRLLADRMPPSYICPERSGTAAQGKTHFMVITGKHTMFDPEKSLTLSDVTVLDGTANTMMVIESTDAVPWMEPRDLEFESMSFIINDPAGNAIGGHRGGVNISMADGSTRYFVNGLDPQTVKNLAQVDDGNAIQLDP